MGKQNKFDYDQFRRNIALRLRAGEINVITDENVFDPIRLDLIRAATELEEPPIETPPEGVKPMPTGIIKYRSVSAKRTDRSNKRKSDSRPDNQKISDEYKKYRTSDDYVLECFESGFNYGSTKYRLESYGRHIAITELMAITDTLLPSINAWRKRPLQPIYPFIWILTLSFDVLTEPSEASSAYAVMAINLRGERDVLGYYVGSIEADNPLVTILKDLRDRGVEDILIACVEAPVEHHESISKAYPQCEVNACLTLQQQISLPLLVGADKSKFIKDLRILYNVADMDEFQRHWQLISDKWGERYPMLITNWQHNKEYLSVPYRYPFLVRNTVHRFTLIEYLQQELTKYHKENGPYANESEFFKDAYRVSKRLLKGKYTHVTRWSMITEQLINVFGDRVKQHLTV